VHQRVAIVYHAFAHYRSAINEALLQSTTHDYFFVGDAGDPQQSGIKSWIPPDPCRFIPTKSHLLAGRFLIQSTVVNIALRRDITTIIFLGDAQFLTTWLAAALARLTGKRVLFWTHGWTRRERGVKDFIRSAFYRLAHGLLLYGHGAKMIALDHGFKPEQLYVIYNSLDYAAQQVARASIPLTRLHETRAAFFTHPERPLLICTSRMLPMRRLDLLLEAMCHLRDHGSAVNLLLVGDGPERPALEAIARHEQLAVSFYGECYDEKVLAGLVMAADLTVVPGRIGLNAMHSLAYGTPVVTQDAPDDQGPEWESIIPGFNGGFYQPNSSQDLARAIKDWLNPVLSLSEISANCEEIITRFYNPHFQRWAIDRAVSGVPADDLFWMRETDPVHTPKESSTDDALAEEPTAKHLVDS